MRIFKDLDLVEQLGTGIKRILKYYDENIYDFTTNFIKVDFIFNENTLFKENGNNIDKLNNTQYEILSLIKENEYITQNEIANKLKINRISVAKNIKILKEKDIIERIGSNKMGKWKILKP